MQSLVLGCVLDLCENPKVRFHNEYIDSLIDNSVTYIVS